MAGPIAEAFVQLSAETRDFERDVPAAVRDAMGRAEDEAKDGGDAIADALGDASVDAADALDKIGAAAKDVGDDIRSTEDIISSWADTTKSSAVEAARELAETEAAVRALATALGTNLDESTDEVRAGLQAVVADLREAGAEFDEIRANADQVATGLRDAGAAAGSSWDDIAAGSGKARAGLKDMNSEGGQARSVLANMVGNSTQDIAGLGGVTGTLGMALGQVGEYATEGGLHLKDLAAVAGPMALVTVAGLAISEVLGDIAAAKAWRADEVKAYTEALHDTEDAAAAVRQKLEDAGKVEFQTSVFGALDITSALNTAGVSADQFAQLIAGGDPVIQAWRDSLEQAGVKVQGVGLVAEAAAQQHALFAKAQDAAAVSATFFAGTMTDAATEGLGLTGKLDGLNGSLNGLNGTTDASTEATGRSKAAMEAHARVIDDQATAYDNAEQALQDLLTAQLSQFSSELALEGRTRATGDAISDYTGLLWEQIAGTYEGEDANRDLAEAANAAYQAALNQAAGAAQLATDQAEAEGKTLSAADAARIQRDELQKVANSLAPDSPLRARIQGYADDLTNKIPKNIGTHFDISFSTGAIPLPRVGGPVVRYADGDIVDRPTLGVFGEAGREVNINLTRPARAMDLMDRSGLGQMWDERRGGSGVQVGSLVTIQEAHIADRTDVDLVAQRLMGSLAALL